MPALVKGAIVLDGTCKVRLLGEPRRIPGGLVVDVERAEDSADPSMRLRDGSICTIKKEADGGWFRAIVVAHEVPAREVHGSPWCQTWERAKGHAERYARKSGLTVAYSD